MYLGIDLGSFWAMQSSQFDDQTSFSEKDATVAFYATPTARPNRLSSQEHKGTKRLSKR